MNKGASQSAGSDLASKPDAGSERANPKRIDITPRLSGGVDVLSRDYFLTQVQREKRRADRSRAPLSLVFMSFAGHGGFDEDDHRDIITDLCLSKRETDVIGYFGEGVVAFLLPYSETKAAKPTNVPGPDFRRPRIPL